MRAKIKLAFRRSAEVMRKKGGNYQQRLKRQTRRYLKRTKTLSRLVLTTIHDLEQLPLFDINLYVLIENFKSYYEVLMKFIDLVERRILKDEKIPHKDKLFSIFEPHVEWLQKGKQGNKVELGHNVMVTSDQYHFIVDWKVLIKETDKEQGIELRDRLQQRFSTGYQFDSISFDRGYYSLLVKQALEQLFSKVIMPKPGYKTQEQQLLENGKEFKLLRNKHNAVESNINELEHSGVNKVPDKGLHSFRRYVAMGVVAHNIKKLGLLVMEKELLPTLVKHHRSRFQKAA